MALATETSAEHVEKFAETPPGLHDLIRKRWSPRSFSAREVSTQDLKTILEAARWAASSYNEQPWRLLVARKSDHAAYEKILHLLAPANQAWAKTAPVCLSWLPSGRFHTMARPNVTGCTTQAKH